MSKQDTSSLSGKVAIVTGSGRENGIGAAIAYALARDGASVAVNYVSDGSAARAEKVAAKIRSYGVGAVAVQADVATPEGAQSLVEQTLTALGTDHIDILVNNAGAGTAQGKLATEVTQAEVERAFAINVFSGLYAVQAAVPHMPQGGRIVNVGSVVSRLTHLPGVALYGAAKAAQDYLTAALATELGRARGITVNTVAPGPTSTDAAGWFPAGEMRDEVGAALLGLTRLGRRPGRPDEVADAVAMLVSDQGRWITGQHISASGGI